MRSDLIHRIVFSAWMMDQSYAASYLPAIGNLIQGKKVKFYDNDVNHVTPKIYGQTPTGEAQEMPVHEGDGYTLSGIKTPSVFVIPIRGVITKNDQFCGPLGMESLIDLLNAADHNPNVKSIVLDFDSPGGEATIIDSVARKIEAISTPIISYYNGICASAAYYIAAATDEIYASEATDIVGSIGTMITFADFSEAMKSQGIKLHEVYADQSVNKNKVFAEALKGNYKPLKEELLNPYAQAFIDSVKSGRPEIQDESVFTGKTFMSNQAIDLKMIDGIKSKSAVLKRAFELGQATTESTTSTQTQTEMSNSTKTIAAILGYETLESKDGHVSLSDSDIAKLEAHLSDAAPIVATLEETAAPAAEDSETLTLLKEIKAKQDIQANEIGTLKGSVRKIYTEMEMDAEPPVDLSTKEKIESASSAANFLEESDDDSWNKMADEDLANA